MNTNEELENAVKRLCEAWNEVKKSLADVVDSLLHVWSQQAEEDRKAKLRDLHRLDPERGDFQHRTNGKRPLEARFRSADEEAHYRKLEAYTNPVVRTTREKSDLRRGRRD